MNDREILQTLIYVHDHVLVSEERFARDHHFLDAEGNPLPVTPQSAALAARCNIEGAIVTALWKLHLITERANHLSSECHAVMCALGDTRGFRRGGFAKVRYVQRFCNMNGFPATRSLIIRTIRRLSS